MTDRTGALAAVAFALVLVASAVMMPVIPGGLPDAGGESTPTPTPKSGEVYEPEPSTPAQGVDADRDAPDDLHEVPTSRIEPMSNDRGSDAPPTPESVRASAGSQTMQIETTVVDGEPALVLADDRTHEGRWVSVETSWLQEVHGEIPETVTIEHESGDVYSESVRVRGESATFYVREFSSNTVTFSGEVSISADPADDGSQYSYEINDLDAASDVTVNMTGVTNTETETRSWSGLASGDSKTVDVAGNQAPTEQSVTFVGEESTSAQSRSGTGVSTGSTTIDVGGDAAPRNAEITFTGSTTTSSASDSATGISSDGSGTFSVGGNLDPTNDELTITGHVTTATYSPMNDEGDGSQDGKNGFIGDAAGDYGMDSAIKMNPDTSGKLTEASLYFGGSHLDGFTPNVDVYLVQSSDVGQDGGYARKRQLAAEWDRVENCHI